MRRQANIGEAEYEVFSDDLQQFDIQDIFNALDRIGAQPRGEYGMAFPESAIIVQAVRNAEYTRKTRIRPEQLRPEVQEALAASAEHARRISSGQPVELVAVDVDKLILDAVKVRRALPAKSVPEPVATVCPHCSMAERMENDPISLGKLAAFYNDKALRALSRLAQEKQADL